MNEIEELGERLKLLRTEKNESLEDVAKITGVSKSLISKYERGQVDPGLKQLRKLVKYYKVSLEWLFGFAENREPISIESPLDGLTDEKKIQAIQFIEFLKRE